MGARRCIDPLSTTPLLAAVQLLRSAVDKQADIQEKAILEDRASHALAAQLSERLNDVQEALKDMTAKFKAKEKEYDRLVKDIKEKAKEFMYQEHTEKLKINELMNQLGLKMDEVTKAKGMNGLFAKKIEDNQNLIDQAGARLILGALPPVAAV